METLLKDTSIIFPNYNGGNYIKVHIKNFSKVKFPIKELLIIDDCSTDNSLEIIDNCIEEIQLEFPIRIIVHEKNRGTSATRNTGIHEAVGKYLCFIDSDAEFSPDTIPALVSDLKNYDITYPTIIDTQTRKKASPNPIGYRFHKEKCPSSTMFAVKKSSLSRMDMFFDELIEIYGDEVDFFLRAYAFGLTFKYCPNVVIYHRYIRSATLAQYYFIGKNHCYLALKLGGILKYKYPFLLFMLVNLVRNFVIAITKRYIVNIIPTQQKFNVSRFCLFQLYFKGIFWNIKNLKKIFSQRCKLKKALKKARVNNLSNV